MSATCVWLSVVETQEILDISQPAVLYRINKGLVDSRKADNPGRAGKKYEIALDSLPQDAQDRYWAQVRAQQEALNPGKAARAFQKAQAQAEAAEAQTVEANEEYLEAPKWQKDIIDERLRIVTESYHMTIAETLKWAEEQGYKVSRGTLYRWRKAYEEGGKNALAAGYGNRAGDSIIPDDVFEQYCAAYLSQNQTSSFDAYQRALGYMVIHYPSVLAARKDAPSLKAFEYRLKRTKDESAIYYARHGESAWNRKYGYYIAADYSAAFCGETAVSDHMQFDVLVTDPQTGKPVRPWLTAWCDWKSRKLLAWDIHTSDPCSDHIFNSFHTMCSEFGLPQNILIDNGRDYRSKDFAGGRNVTRKIDRKIDVKRTSSLMEDLGIKPFFALPFNAQRKNIERLFKDFHNKFERHFKGYTGTNIVKRPEILKEQIKRGELMTFEELKRIAEDFIVNVFNKRIFGKNAVHVGKSPDQVWEEDNVTLRRASERTLAVFLQRTSEALRVTRNGVRDPQLKDQDVYYWAEEMVSLVGSYVYLRRDLKKYGTAWVYAVGDDRKPLCLATIKGTVDPFADSEASKEELKKQIARKRKVTKAVRAAAAVNDTATPDDKLEMLKAAAAYTDAKRGYTPALQPSTIEVQLTPLDETAREQERFIKDGTTNAPIPVIKAPKRKKLYFSRTEMECDLGGSDE